MEELRSLQARWDEPGAAGVTRREAMVARLRALREDGGFSPEPLDLRGIVLIEEDLTGLDLCGADLSGADLSRANLEGVNLLRARLRGTTLYQARLARAELAGADLEGANLQRADATGTGLGLACLRDANLSEAQLENATLTDSDLRGSDLRLCRMRGARVRSADLRGAEVSRADLRDVELEESRLERAVIDRTDLRGANLRGLRGYQDASWIGADIREIDFTGAYLCRRFILDQNYLEEFRNQNRISRAVHFVWWLTSDCGRSLTRWGLLTGILAVAFAGVYTLVGVDYGDYHTPLSPLYYSVVTLTTLGYGDVLPASTAAQVVAMVEVIIGYVMLGGLLSIFSNKMARRAE